MDRQLQPRATSTPRDRRRAPLALAIGVALAAGATLAGCSSTTSSKASSVASAAQSVLQSAASGAASGAASALQSATGALGSDASSAVASARSAASSALASATGGLDATADITLGKVSTTSDGKAQVPVTITNHQSQAERYTVQVDFKDGSGNLLDTVVLNVDSVPAGQTGSTTAVSHRTLSGTVAASVARALRY